MLLFDAIDRHGDRAAARTPPSGGAFNKPEHCLAVLEAGGFTERSAAIVRAEWRVPDAQAMQRLLERACEVIPAERLWVNPDCGLKTRGWPETEAALTNMVRAAKALRAKLAARQPDALTA